MKKHFLIISCIGLFATNGYAQQIFANPPLVGIATPFPTNTNVGIGINSPTYGKLDVNGIVAAAPRAAAVYANPVAGAYNAGTRFALNASATNPYGIGIGAQDPGTGTFSMWFQTGGINGGGYKWYIGGNQKMTMDPLGNVGIGTSTPTFGKLDVDGIVAAAPTSPSAYLDPIAGAYNAGTRLALNASTANPYGIGIGAQDPSTGTYPMWFQTGDLNGGGYKWFIGGTQKMTMDPLGNIGIGTSTPSTQLHTTGGVRFQGLTATTYTNVVVIDANGNLATQPFSTTGVTLNCSTTNFISKVTGANQLDCSQIFDDGTSVGIGTSSGFTYTGGGAVLTSGGGGIPTGSTITLKVNGITQATSYIATSDERFKKDIKTIEKPLEKIAKLNGVGYNWKTNDFKSLGYKFDNTHQLGFIAQELQKVIPEAVIVDGNGYYGVNYNMLIPLLTEAIKEQQQMIESQNNKIDEMQAKMNSTHLRAMAINSFASDSSASIGKGAKLYQNVPNPFSQSTSITYFLTNTSGNAAIMIFDLSGKLLKTVSLSQKGSGSISINGSELNSGMYIYSLVIDGQEIESKRMILTE